MKPIELLTLFRDEVDDKADPHFLTDGAFFIYLTDAVNQYCRYGRGIRDHTSKLTTIEYIAEDPWAEYDERIIKILAAFDEGNSNRRLRIVDWDEYQKGSEDLKSTDYGAYLDNFRYPDQTGVISTIVLGVEENKMRLVNIPTISSSIKLIIERYPIDSVTKDCDTIEGVPINDRIYLLDWVKHKYYSKQDAETFDPDKAEVSRLMFLSNMAKVDSSDMKRTKKQGKTAYGGI